MQISKNDIIANLKKTDIFKDLDIKSLETVSEVVNICFFKQSENIITENQKGYQMFILHKGSVRVKKKTFKNDEEYTVLNLNEANDPFFGELALIDHFSRSATVTALTDVVLLEIDKSKLIELCNKYPIIGYKVFYKVSGIISSRLRKANSDIITLFDALVSEIQKS